MTVMDKYIYKRAVIIGLDGMGAFDLQTDTPEIHRVFGEYAVSHKALSLYPTSSAQNWGAMLVGADPDVHGLSNSIAGRQNYSSVKLPTVFSTLRKYNPGAVLCSVSNWSPINTGMIEEDLGVYKENTSNGEITTEKVVNCVKEKKPDLLFIQIDDPDEFGHAYGYGSEKHLECIRNVDRMVGRIYDAYAEAGIAEDTLFISITDHGGLINAHGGYSDEEKFIFFAVRGKTVCKTKDFFAVTKDVNAIVRHAFGIPLESYNEKGYSSQIPEGLFSDCNGEYIIKKAGRFDVINKPTPAVGSENGLYSYFSKNDIKLAMFFDNSIKDETGNYEFTECGHTKYYSEGIYGAMGEFGTNGYLVCDDIKFGKDDFTVCAWLKIDDAPTGECFYCSNKTMQESGPGFSLCFTCMGTFVGIETEDPKSYTEVATSFFGDLSGGWINVIYSFDKKNLKIDVYYNFVKKNSIDLAPCFDSSVDSLPFLIGAEGSLSLNKDRNVLFNIDDFLIFGKAFSDEDVKKLASYYGL